MATKAHHDAEEGYIDYDNQMRPKKVTFNPRGLTIVWGGDSRYWRLPSPPGPAELIQVSWLEVTATTLLPEGKYKICFQLSLKPDAFGWNGCQVYLMAKIGRRGKYKWTKISLPANPNDYLVIDVPSSNNEDDRKLYFGLYEVWSGKWKGGLLIHNAVVEKVEED